MRGLTYQFEESERDGVAHDVGQHEGLEEADGRRLVWRHSAPGCGGGGALLGLLRHQPAGEGGGGGEGRGGEGRGECHTTHRM